ncbi:MAG: ABC transporter ATP-binding protein/permease [Hydrogenothermaceae bacterium]|nr:ABC transporter ATP-binding protein/permease [Hydrogenothermaceae bacterium]
MDKDSLKFLYSRFRDYKLHIILAIVGSIIEASSLAGLTYIVKEVIDKVFIDKDFEKLKLILIVIFTLAILKQIGFILKEYVFPYALYRVLKGLREEIFNKIVEGKYSAIQSRQFGDIISRASNDVEALRHSIILVGVDFITQLFTAVAMVSVLVYRDYRLFLIFLVAAPIFALSFNYFGEKRKKYTQRVQESFGEYTQIVNQTLSGLETIKLFSKENIIFLFNRINENFFKNQRKNALYDVLYLSSLEIASYIGIAGIILYGGISIVEGRITTGDLFSFLSALLILVNSLQIIQRGIMQIKVLSPVIHRIQSILNIEAEKQEGKPFSCLREKIVFKDVSLLIRDKVILKDIDIEIRKGEKIGIVGHTGSGKSSFLKLVYGLYQDEYRGSIKIDGIELRDLNLNSYREKVGVVSQDVFMFNDTVRNNLLIANPKADEEKIVKAILAAKADFVFQLPQGLDTVIGERGGVLSGGERQRVAFARLYLKDPEIVILDEGTSALDTTTEEEVMREFYKYFKDRTVLIVAHRASTLRECNRIITFENGRVSGEEKWV